MIVITQAMTRALKLVAVDLPGQRAQARLSTIEKYLVFARRHQLVKTRHEETELIEMLLAGLKFELAIVELRLSRPSEL